MATYIMSDLHGAFDELNEMLELIQFSQEDTLYILGDVVDRGDNGIEILQMVMKTPNIKMILGNHEYMLLQFFEPDADEKIKRRWNRNGNFTTLNGLDKVTPEEKKDILDFIRSMPSEIRINVNGTDYILVHGFLGETTHDRVWNRPSLTMDKLSSLSPEVCSMLISSVKCRKLYECDHSIRERLAKAKEQTKQSRTNEQKINREHNVKRGGQIR